MDDSFFSGSPFDPESRLSGRSKRPTEQSIDNLFDQAQKALNELNIPEAGGGFSGGSFTGGTVTDGNNTDGNNNYGKDSDGDSQATGANFTYPSTSAGDSSTPERLYTLKEILQSIGPDENQAVNWEALEDVELDVSVVLGDTEMTMENVMRLKNGSVVSLDAQKNDPVTLMVNGQPIARGEVMTRNGKFCIRITEILSDRF